MNYIVVNGYPKSGKDTFVEYCQQALGRRYSTNLSTVDFVKQMAKLSGWDGSKTPENRKFLSDLKKLLTEWNDVPYKFLINTANNWKVESYCDFSIDESELWVFIHCREPEEIDKFVQRNGAKTVLIRRAAVEGDNQSNDSDANVLDYKYDYVIENNGTLDELKKKAYKFIEEIQK